MRWGGHLTQSSLEWGPSPQELDHVRAHTPPLFLFSSLLILFSALCILIHKKPSKCISVLKTPDFRLPPAFCQHKVGFALRHLSFPNFSESFARLSGAGVSQ